MEWITKFIKGKPQVSVGKIASDRVELDRRAVEAAQRAVRDYHRVFERLAEYDRT